MSVAVRELRVLLLPVVPPPEPWDLLLPQAAVAELVRVPFSEPPPQPAPDWLCGHLAWRGLQLPLVRPVPGSTGVQVGRQCCAVVCLAPSGSATAPFFAIESPDMPRLERVTPEVLAPDDPAPDRDRGLFIQTRLRLRGQPAGLLDLDAVERALAQLARSGPGDPGPEP